MSKKKSIGHYEVGYGRPPRATQFKKGQSGNPRGRPKGAKGFDAQLKETFGQKVEVQLMGKTRRITAGQAMLLKLTAKALGGDMAALRHGLGLFQVSQSGDAPSAVFDSERDRELIASYFAASAPEPRRKARKGGRS
jgi:hypothetical protein